MHLMHASNLLQSLTYVYFLLQGGSFGKNYSVLAFAFFLTKRSMGTTLEMLDVTQVDKCLFSLRKL